MDPFATHSGSMTSICISCIGFQLCFWVNLTANRRRDYERMRCRHWLIIQISGAFAKIVAVTRSNKERLAARFTGNFAYVLSILTAVVFHRCLQETTKKYFMTDRSGSLVQKQMLSG